MAGSSDSNDASDIFWPGYVDAISNLAINLLFVIAVMCIVILSFVLEETTKGKPQEGTVAQDVQYVNDSNTASQREQAKQIQALQAENAQLREQIEAARQSAARSQSNSASGAANNAAPSTNNVPNPAPRMEVMHARQEVIKEEKGQSSMHAVGAGLIILFDPKVVTLSPEESKDMVRRLQAYGPVTSTRWQITVITPKGFSESARLAYYRAVAVRNALIQQGTAADLIQMRVLESAQEGADAARVTVNAQN